MPCKLGAMPLCWIMLATSLALKNSVGCKLAGGWTQGLVPLAGRATLLPALLPGWVVMWVVVLVVVWVAVMAVSGGLQRVSLRNKRSLRLPSNNVNRQKCTEFVINLAF